MTAEFSEDPEQDLHNRAMKIVTGFGPGQRPKNQQRSLLKLMYQYESDGTAIVKRWGNSYERRRCLISMLKRGWVDTINLTDSEKTDFLLIRHAGIRWQTTPLGMEIARIYTEDLPK